ncbi:hypothetical protein [Novosphingobium sp.]|uniref:hypothetical protein n=1 Tax=Novosphingobium sp. TaxID=1874826 RepID=UPI003BAB6A3A
MKFNGLIWTTAAIVLGLPTAAPALAQERPIASESAAQNAAVKSPDTITWGDLAKGHNSFTASQAQDRLEKAGYRKVTRLRLDGDGLWLADATMNDVAVHVALDFKGNVAEH